MPKPRGTFERSDVPKKGYPFRAEVPEEIELAIWCPDEEAKAPPEQVHMNLHVPGFNTPIVMRWKSPDTLGFIIEEMISYRREVWPDSEPIKGEKPPRRRKGLST